jgi:hypothetical protein
VHVGGLAGSLARGICTRLHCDACHRCHTVPCCHTRGTFVSCVSHLALASSGLAGFPHSLFRFWRPATIPNEAGEDLMLKRPRATKLSNTGPVNAAALATVTYLCNCSRAPSSPALVRSASSPPPNQSRALIRIVPHRWQIVQYTLIVARIEDIWARTS